jgi:hypothetical protein
MMETRGNSSYKRACGQWAPIRRLDAVFSGETRLTLTILGSLCVLVGVLAFAVVPAQAAVTHDFLPE